MNWIRTEGLPLGRAFKFFSKLSADTTLRFRDDNELKCVGQFSFCEVGGVVYKDVRLFENLIRIDDRLPQKIYITQGV